MAASANAARFTGEVLGGRYRIVRRIGSGGMADVFAVEHLRLASPFAAKILRHQHGVSVRRFLREARLLAQLKSDHIVTVFDIGDPNEESPYYVMELLNGKDLRRLLAATPELSIERAVKMVTDACAGIGVAHAAGLVHRDLKPANLFVTHRDSGEEVVKLLDFGVAKANEGTSTEHGALIGTVRYMAPEQIEHAGVVTARSDVRGLGAILYECLTGRPPHVADSVERLLFKVLNEPIEPMRASRSDIPESLDQIVLKALERNPSDRFPSAGAFAQALAPFAATRGLGFSTGDTTLGDTTSRSPATVRAAKGLRFGALGLGLATVAASGALGRSDSPYGEATSSKREPVVAVATPEPRRGTTHRAVVPSRAEATDSSRAASAETKEHPPSARVLPAAGNSVSTRTRQQAAQSAPAASATAAPAPAHGESFAKIDSRNPYDP
jgi:serine/threonine protein kinase